MSRPTKPDSSQLMHWRRDHVTAWIIMKLYEKFRPLKASELAKTWEDHHLRVGEQRVLETIEKLCNLEGES